MRELSISAAWDETKALLNRDGRLFASVALALIVLPAIVIGLIDPRTPEQENGPLWFDLLSFAASLLSLVGQMAIIRLALPPSTTVGAAVGHAVQRLGKYVLALLILVLGAIALAMPVAVIMAASGMSPKTVETMTADTIPGPVLAGILVLLFVMIAIGVRFILAMQAAVAENPGPLDMLKRSWALTSTHWFRLFGFLLMIVLAAIVVLAVVTLTVGSIVKLSLGAVEPMSLAALIISLVEAAVTGVFSVIFTLMLTRIYVQLSGRETIADEA